MILEIPVAASPGQFLTKPNSCFEYRPDGSPSCAIDIHRSIVRSNSITRLPLSHNDALNRCNYSALKSVRSGRTKNNSRVGTEQDGVIPSIRVAPGMRSKNDRVERSEKEAASTFDDAKKKQPTDLSTKRSRHSGLHIVRMSRPTHSPNDALLYHFSAGNRSIRYV